MGGEVGEVIEEDLFHRVFVALEMHADRDNEILIPLNKCCFAEFYLPWKCENELVIEWMLQIEKIYESESTSSRRSGRS